MAVVPSALARLAVVSLVALGAGGVVAGAPPTGAKAPRDVSAVLARVREAAGLPAMGGAVVRGDGLVAIGVDGVRRRGSEAKATAKDRWHLGSCTKAMTATLLAMLVEEKRLAWDDSPIDVFPHLSGSDARWREATLYRLVRHRAGAPANLDAGGLWGRLWAFHGPPLEARLVLVKGVLAAPPGPLDAHVYSNAGYAIAGAMAERATKTPWEELMRKRLFEPLGMASAGFGAPGTKDALDEPLGHRTDGTPVEPGPGSDNPAAIGPAGTVHASLTDWGRFASLHLRGARAAQPGLSRTSFARLHEPPRGLPGVAYAGGWIAAERPWGGRVLTHAGSNTMWFCVAWLAPEKDFAVLVTCNQGGAAEACDRAAAALIEDEQAARAGK
jgi:CubicO group peptidase (beta-lactamase class C family)